MIIDVARVFFRSRTLIWQLAKHKLHEQYAATVLGSCWAILQPILTMLVFWFVFSYGLKLQANDTKIPFFLVIFCGLVPWMAFSDSLFSATQSILAHQHLVKKIVFPLEVLPFVHIVTAMVIHFCMLIFLILVLMLYGIGPSIYLIQITYYILAMVVFSTGLSWMLSALNVFHRDIGQSLSPIITLWFWMTPIVWPAKNVGGYASYLIALNPMYYVIEGYRKTLLYSEPFWTNYGSGVYFWIVSGSMFVLGITFFNRAKIQFCDVL